jgi:hypothetical protein
MFSQDSQRKLVFLLDGGFAWSMSWPMQVRWQRCGREYGFE